VTLILNKADVMLVLDMKDCVDLVEKAFAELSNGTAVLPLRISITPPEGLSLYMPAYLKEMKALACKVVTVYKNNPSKHRLPTIIGKVLLQDPDTGDVLCIMDGGYLTGVRTGAVSGVATKYMARSVEGQTAGIYGAGAQAKMQLWGISVARKLSSAFVHDISADAADKFAEEMSAKLQIPVTRVDHGDKLLDTDIICTATSSATPLFDGKKLKPGTHINGIGSHTPDTRELDTETIKRSVLTGDSKEACFKEAGDIMIPLSEGAITDAHFYGDLGEIVTGKKTARRSDQDITLFKSNGLAIQDVAAAQVVYQKAVAAGIGIKVEI
jgi:ornithine cyclodeaminase/alanine dehydrogenase-like protein (mu-crystallin family)